MHRVLFRDFWETSDHPGDPAPLQPRFGALWLLTFLKTKIIFEKEEISDCQWDSGKYNRAADGDWENSVRSQGVYLEREWGVIVPCTMFLVSSSINVFVFHIMWRIPSGQTSYIRLFKIATIPKIVNSQDYNHRVFPSLWKESFKRLMNITVGGIETVLLFLVGKQIENHYPDVCVAIRAFFLVIEHTHLSTKFKSVHYIYLHYIT